MLLLYNRKKRCLSFLRFVQICSPETINNVSLFFFLLKFTCILCKKHGTKWKKNDCLHSIFFSQWLTLLCNKNEGSFVQTVDCFNKMCNYFLSSCLLFSEHIPESGSLSFLLLARCVEFLLTYIQENSLVTAVCQISIRNQSAVCYAFSGSRRLFDVILRSLILPSARSNGFL